MEVNGQLHAPALYPQGKSHWYPLDRRLSRPQNRSGRGDEEKNSQPLPGPTPPIIQAVAWRCITELSRLHSAMSHTLRQRVSGGTRKSCFLFSQTSSPTDFLLLISYLGNVNL
jgi:hypothetical protein